jgi:hypothetical protein
LLETFERERLPREQPLDARLAQAEPIAKCRIGEPLSFEVPFELGDEEADLCHEVRMLRGATAATMGESIDIRYFMMPISVQIDAKVLYSDT